jgi:hypothetical protein
VGVVGVGVVGVGSTYRPHEPVNQEECRGIEVGAGGKAAHARAQVSVARKEKRVNLVEPQGTGDRYAGTGPEKFHQYERDDHRGGHVPF